MKLKAIAGEQKPQDVETTVEVKLRNHGDQKVFIEIDGYIVAAFKVKNEQIVMSRVGCVSSKHVATTALDQKIVEVE